MELTTQPVGNRPDPAAAPKPVAPRRLIVGIASLDRREFLTDTVHHIASQNRLPDLVVLSISQEQDIDRAAMVGLPFPIRVIVGPRGISAQRNRIFTCLEPADILLCLGDDFLMRADFLENTLDLFERRPDIVLATGTMLGDSVLGRIRDHADALNFLGRPQETDGSEHLREIYYGHGSNIAVRARPVLRFGLRFDEALPHNNLLEDVDFSRQLALYGELVRSNQLCGVQLASSANRAPGLKLGYSQIIDAVYLHRKGTVSLGKLTWETAGNVLSNVSLSLRPRQWRDNRGRLRGNLRAVLDILRGRIDLQHTADI